jgi:hypothetical protein
VIIVGIASDARIRGVVCNPVKTPDDCNVAVRVRATALLLMSNIAIEALNRFMAASVITLNP